MIVITITLHEFAHAKMADHLGDPTPKLQGRVTLNPQKHIDPIGLLLLFIVGFGWGRPVQFDPFNLKNPRRDAAIISLAGPVTNFILALASAALLRIFTVADVSYLTTIGSLLLIPFISINVLLGLFNLIPIAPLDGFKIVGGILSPKQAEEWHKLERYGIIFLLAFIFPFGDGSMLQMFLSPVIQWVTNLLIP